MKFKIGDKVRVRQWDDMVKECGIEGVIIPTRCSFVPSMRKYCGKIATVEKLTGQKNYRLRFDTELSYYNFSDDMLEPVKNECILIYRDGLKVIAEDKNTGKKGIARCNPIDKFDFYTGAKLAFEWLTGNEKEKVKFADGMGIWCENKSQFDELMKILETMGYKWSSGDMPTKYNPPACAMDVRIFTVNKPDCKNVIFYGFASDKPDGFTYVDFSDVDFSDCVQKIKVGDIVEIVDTGKMYPTHYEWVKEHVPDLAVYYAYGDSAGYHDKIKRVSGKFKVQHIADGKAYVMSNARGDRKCYLVGLEGLAKC